MFVPFLYRLRQHGVPVGTQEALALAKAMVIGLHDSSLDGFYYTARALCVHNEGHLDAFDQAFLAEFRGVEGKHLQLKEELMQWLKDAKLRPEDLTPEERKLLEELDIEELKRLFEERMNEQRERHDRGNRWVGTAGTSPFGRQGEGKEGVRVGGAGGNKSAVQVADARKYRPYRSDLALDVRQMEMALRRLRMWHREGGDEELDLDGTIDKTANNAGELEVVVRPPIRPNTRVILMMDVGGSMDPYVDLMNRLFSATKKATHWKELRTYYFHNCVYGRVYKTERFDDPVWVQDLLHECGRHYKLIMVGDALMAPYELMRQGGAIGINDSNALPGIAWLTLLQQHFKSSIWLNPEPPTYWDGNTIQAVRQVFDMYPLTLEGLTQSMQQLSRGRNIRK
ncbi:MAG TPA: VWA domain-containing protein [Polyangiales bacterium]|nr:VWA domain-containing protein [Polyangiales bacterium]